MTEDPLIEGQQGKYISSQSCIRAHFRPPAPVKIKFGLRKKTRLQFQIAPIHCERSKLSSLNFFGLAQIYFEQVLKILIPRDFLGGNGAPNSEGCTARISPTLISGHMGSIVTLR